MYMPVTSYLNVMYSLCLEPIASNNDCLIMFHYDSFSKKQFYIQLMINEIKNNSFNFEQNKYNCKQYEKIITVKHSEIVFGSMAHLFRLTTTINQYVALIKCAKFITKWRNEKSIENIE